MRCDLRRKISTVRHYWILYTGLCLRMYHITELQTRYRPTYSHPWKKVEEVSHPTPSKNKAVVDIRLLPVLCYPWWVVSQYGSRCQIRTTLCWVTEYMYMPFRVAYSWSLCENLIPSIKPEVHNTSQRRQRRAEPWPSVGLTSTYRPIDWTCNSGDKLADRQTHRRIERYAYHCTPFTCRGWTGVTKCTLLVNNAT